MHGTGWQSSWAVSDTALPTVERVQPNAGQPRRVRHDSRGSLRGFPIVKASPERARSIDASMLAPWVEQVEYFVGDGLGGREIGRASCREKCVSPCRSRGSPYHEKKNKK